MDKSSAYYFGSANEHPGGDLVLPTEILKVFKDEIPNIDEIVKLNHEVLNIIWSGDQIKTKTSKGDFQSDVCIVTFPPGVINHFHEKLFHPNLPESKLKGYASFNPGAVGKYFIEWKENWREKNNHPIMLAHG